MPSSHTDQINEIMKLVILTSPKSILDVGIGFGKYGFLSREYLENIDIKKKYNENWKIQIDGIEVFEEYLNPIQEIIYNNIYRGNALDVLPTIKIRYDLVLLIDVLEHFEYEDGLKVLKQCIKCGRNVLFSTPKDIGKQEKEHGNVFETHRFQWKKKHFNIFNTKFFLPNEYSLICYIGEDAQRIQKELARMKLRSRIRRYVPFAKSLHKKYWQYKTNKS